MSAPASATSAVTWLFRDDILEGSPAQDRKNPVVEREKAEVAAGSAGHARADAADHDRDRERQEEQREEELSRPADGRHRGEQDADRRDAEVGERDAGDRRGVDAREEERERRQRDELGNREEGECRDRLREPDRAPIAGREQQAVEEPLLPLRDEGPRQAEQGGEDQRDPEEPLRRELRALRRQGEVEDDERRDHEQEHRRHRVARPQLEDQVLPGQNRHVVEVAPHANASRLRASGSSRAGSCVATSNVARSRSSESSRSSSADPSSSSALYGSSSRSRLGSCRSTRQSASRCSIPRENEPVRSLRTRQSPKRSSSIPIRSRRSGTR